MDLQKKLVVLAAPAALATTLALTPANDAEAAIFYYDYEAMITSVDSNISTLNVGDIMNISGSIDTDGLFDAAASSTRVHLPIYDENNLGFTLTLDGADYTSFGDIDALGSTTNRGIISNAVTFSTYDDNVYADGTQLYQILCFNEEQISEEAASDIEDSVSAIFENCTTFYANALNNASFEAAVQNAIFSFDTDETAPQNSVASPASSLALLGFAGLALTASRRRKTKPVVVLTSA
ncbi:hypothetical protein C6Y40_07750 [Alteromonas alba]|uniref:PEP-CTERM protein-sorting domain-containing protein n=1 Tax=Alteromonas alba TaxID=2079529 RepID=A0A2S9VCH4_9ALTE|nr:hypothetical protein [Alteromonas alba]PRO74153.1 hypothetical protein C6Y40_07750 [Alteromonas alba]